MSLSDQERGVPLKSALFLISVVAVGLVALGIYVGNHFFWNQSASDPKAQADFERIQSLVKTNPDNYNARVALGFQLLARRKKNEALKEFLEAYKQDSKSQTTRFGLGYAYRDVGNNDKAIEILEPLVKEYPFYFLAQCNLALAYQNIKQYDKAIAAYEFALKIDPGAADVYYELARAYSDMGNKEKALINVNQALKFVPDYKEALELKTSLSNH